MSPHLNNFKKCSDEGPKLMLYFKETERNDLRHVLKILSGATTHPSVNLISMQIMLEIGPWLTNFLVSLNHSADTDKNKKHGFAFYPFFC